MLVEDADLDLVGQVGSRLLGTLRAPFEIAGKQVQIGASVGAAMSAADQREAEVLLRNADVAMYTAKSGAKPARDLRGQHARRGHRLELKADLERASTAAPGPLPADLRACRRRAGRLRTLVRWRHPDRGEVGPGDLCRSPRRRA